MTATCPLPSKRASSCACDSDATVKCDLVLGRDERELEEQSVAHRGGVLLGWRLNAALPVSALFVMGGGCHLPSLARCLLLVDGMDGSC